MRVISNSHTGYRTVDEEFGPPDHTKVRDLDRPLSLIQQFHKAAEIFLGIGPKPKTHRRPCQRLPNTTPSEHSRRKTAGVSRSASGKWRAQIYIQGKCKELGRYPTKEIAEAAYNLAYKYYFTKENQ